MNDDYFYQTDNIPPIDVEQMQDFLDNPPLLCGDEDCPRNYEGTYCRCITTVFKHETHYKHYLGLIKVKVESAFVDLIQKNNNLPSK